MDLKIFFSPIEEEVFEGISDPTSFYKNISIFAEKQPEFKGANIALLGVLEEDGSVSNHGAAKGADEIRKKLYRLKNGEKVAFNFTELKKLSEKQQKELISY